MPPSPPDRPPLMVGPLSGAVTGQMAAFREAVRAVPGALAVDAAFASPIRVLRYWARLPGAFRRSRGPVYITTSRNHRGFWLRDLPVLLGAALTRRPVVNHLHGSDFLAFRRAAGWPTGPLLDRLYRRMPLACVPAPGLAAQYAAFPGTAIRVVPNAFDESALGALLPKPADGPLEVLYFSNFIASKGFAVACDAVRLLRAGGLDARLTLCGTILGTADMGAAAVRAYLDNVAREGWATVRPAVGGRDKALVLARAHVMVLPTRYPTEAAPISLIEGLAAGCFVVSTDQGSIPDLLDGFDAAIADSTPRAFAEAIAAFARRPDRDAMALRNRRRAIERHSPDRFRQSIREVLHDARHA